MEKLKVMPIRLTQKAYKDLRKIAYLVELPMAEIIRKGIDDQIREYKKILTNADIAI